MEKFRTKKKSGNATIYFVIAAILLLIIAYLYMRLNWQRFKVEAGFGFAVTVLVIVVLLVLLLLIRHSIKKARRQREEKRLEAERERQAKIEAGEPVSSLGDGKFEVEDIKEVAGIVGDKIGDLAEKAKQEITERTETDE